MRPIQATSIDLDGESHIDLSSVLISSANDFILGIVDLN